MGRSKGSADELERIRRLAVARVVDDGMKPAEVARFLGLCRQTVARWVRSHRDGGRRALKARPHPGKPPSLTREQERFVLRSIRRSPVKFGHVDGLWTSRRVNDLIEREFGIRFNDTYICAWLAKRRVTPQKPEPVAAERDEPAIRRWVRDDWPRIQNEPADTTPALS